MNLFKSYNTLTLFICAITLMLSVFMALGYYSSYIGYYGYDKNEFRRYSKTKEESIKKGVFIEDLNFYSDSVKIESVFIEKAFRWGVSDEDVILLKKSDTLKENDVENLFQLIVSFNDLQNRERIYIPRNTIHLKDGKLEDSLLLKIFIRDTLQNLKQVTTLRVWEKPKIK